MVKAARIKRFDGLDQRGIIALYLPGTQHFKSDVALKVVEHDSAVAGAGPLLEIDHRKPRSDQGARISASSGKAAHQPLQLLVFEFAPATVLAFALHPF